MDVDAGWALRLYRSFKDKLPHGFAEQLILRVSPDHKFPEYHVWVDVPFFESFEFGISQDILFDDPDRALDLIKQEILNYIRRIPIPQINDNIVLSEN